MNELKKNRFKEFVKVFPFIILTLMLIFLGFFMIFYYKQGLSFFISYLPQFLLISITILYVIETKKIADKTAESVESTKRLIEETSKPHEVKRKSIAKNLLFEIHENNNSLNEVKNWIEEIESTKTRFDPIFYSNFFFSAYKILIERYLDFDFNDENLIPQVRTYYSYLNQIKSIIERYNLNSGSDYSKKNKPFSFMELEFKIPLICNMGEKLFKLLENESEFNYSKKEYFYKYKPFKLEE